MGTLRDDGRDIVANDFERLRRDAEANHPPVSSVQMSASSGAPGVISVTRVRFAAIMRPWFESVATRIRRRARRTT
jgi:hypothetical protein